MNTFEIIETGLPPLDEPTNGVALEDPEITGVAGTKNPAIGQNFAMFKTEDQMTDTTTPAPVETPQAELPLPVVEVAAPLPAEPAPAPVAAQPAPVVSVEAFEALQAKFAALEAKHTEATTSRNEWQTKAEDAIETLVIDFAERRGIPVTDDAEPDPPATSTTPTDSAANGAEATQ